MAFTNAVIWETQSGGDDTNNGGGFDTGVAGFPTDGAATLATTASPVFTSASYTFVAGDVGANVYIKSGTNWTPGFYPIASVSAGAATLSAAIGAASIETARQCLPSTAAGCATVASPTSATWGIDYSQQTTAEISYTDMVIGGTTTQFTSALNPVSKNLVGNIIRVTAGTGFTVQRVAVVSTSGTTATCDKSLGTGGSTGGVGGLGGAFASPGLVGSVYVSGSRHYVKTATYTLGSASANVATGTLLVSTGIFIHLEGYGSVRGDLVSPPTIINAAFTAINIISQTAGRFFIANLIVDGNSGSTVVAFNLNSGPGLTYLCTAKNCGGNGFTNGGAFGRTHCISCVASACSIGFNFTSAHGCVASSNTSHGFKDGAQVSCLAYSNGGDGFSMGVAGDMASNCVAYANTGTGFNSLNDTACVNCIAEANSAYGFVGNNNAGVSGLFVNCAGFNNTSGLFNTTQFYRQNPTTVALTGSPFTNAAGNDFSLNTTAGAGASCRAAGFPGAFPAGSTTGYLDIGAAQHADPASSGGSAVAIFGG